MSSDSRELVEVLVSLSPWVAFLILLAWTAAQSLAARREDRHRESDKPGHGARKEGD